MKHRDILTDLRTKSATELVDLLKSEEKKLLEQRFGFATRNLKKTSTIRVNRKQIARIQTLLREKVVEQVSKEK